MYNIPRFMIAATHSGAGKTTLSTALMLALTKRLRVVQPFKVGPDYIDPSYHSLVTGRISRNLDSFLLSQGDLREIFHKSTRDVDIAVVEGVMGLYDGFSGLDDRGSSAAIAKLFQLPVILVMDVKSAARSAAATLLGFQKFDPNVKIAGVILNRIGSPRHFNLVKEAVEHYCQVPVVGWVKNNPDIQVPQRHLGLIPASEGEKINTLVDKILPLMMENIDLDLILKIAEGAIKLPLPDENDSLIMEILREGENVRIAVAKDEAFSFYYHDGLEYLADLGVELVNFSPIHDKELPPNIHGIYIGGGFPEVFIQELSENIAMRQAILHRGQRGMPIYAECGGFMYLTREIVDFSGQGYPMIGLVPGRSFMQKRLVKMGYMEGKALKNNILLAKDQSLTGHEFHYSSFQPDSPCHPWAFAIRKNLGDEPHLDGYAEGNVLASYLHINFFGQKNTAQNFVRKCLEYKDNN